ncbi:DNA-binding response regulator [Sphingobacterium sp.]|uniref:response regulator transcription factor n=1 Tax=Sphingobacterium sp. TaxID=341027 RepID=UPI0028AD6A90|nr:DNA-binding response regulator [Sphingobacterium sp.]
MSLKVLIVEDEMIIARFIEYQLTSLYPGLDLHIALSVDDVDLYMEQNSPDLVLCDIQLNDRMDGIELMERYTATKFFSLVFITSYQSKNSIDRAAALNPENYIIKPLGENRLYAGTHMIIQRLQQQREKNRAIEKLKTLTPAELHILKLIALRHTTKFIADTLFLSPYTIKNTRHRICRKLNLNEENNALLSWAIEHQHILKFL